MIFWGDETGIRSYDVRGRIFSVAGHTPVISKTRKQFGVTMILAVNNRGKFYFAIHENGINSDMFIDFCKRLITLRKEKLILNVDNLRPIKLEK